MSECSKPEQTHMEYAGCEQVSTGEVLTNDASSSLRRLYIGGCESCRGCVCAVYVCLPGICVEYSRDLLLLLLRGRPVRMFCRSPRTNAQWSRLSACSSLLKDLLGCLARHLGLELGNFLIRRQDGLLIRGP